MFNVQFLVETVVARLEKFVPGSQPCISIKDPSVGSMDPLFSCLCTLEFALEGYSGRIIPILEVIILETSIKNKHIPAVAMLERVCKHTH